jgi:PAS domain S-box-containing protein
MSAEGVAAAFFARCATPALVVGFDGQVLAANPAWRPVSGWAPEDLLGRSLVEFLHPGDLDAGHTDRAALASGALAGSWDARMLCRDGVPRWLAWEVSADPATRTYACLARQPTREEMQRQERFKVDFINMAAHELNTPLTPIQLALDTLHMRFDPVLDREARGSVDLVQRNFRRLRELVGELLDASRIHAGRLPLDLREEDLGALVRQVALEKEAAAREAGAALRVQAEEGLRCVADAPRLRQVLDNFIACGLAAAAQAAAGDAPARQQALRLRAERDGAEAVVSVACPGPPLTAQQRDRLFHPFPRTDEPSQPSQVGTGLGLYLARGIVELHGGRVWVQEGGSGGDPARAPADKAGSQAAGGLVLTFALPLEGPGALPRPPGGVPERPLEMGLVGLPPARLV